MELGKNQAEMQRWDIEPLRNLFAAVKNGFENEHHRGQTCSSALGPMRESRCQLQRSGLSGFDVVDGVPTRG